VGDLERLLGEAIGVVEGGVGAVLDCVLDAPVGRDAEGKAVGQEEANGTVQSKGDDVLEEGAEERGGGKAVLVG